MIFDFFTGKLAYMVSALYAASIPKKMKEEPTHKTMIIGIKKPRTKPPKVSIIVTTDIKVKNGITAAITARNIPPMIKSFFIRSNMIIAQIEKIHDVLETCLVDDSVRSISLFHFSGIIG